MTEMENNILQMKDMIREILVILEEQSDSEGKMYIRHRCEYREECREYEDD